MLGAGPLAGTYVLPLARTMTPEGTLRGQSSARTTQPSSAAARGQHSGRTHEVVRTLPRNRRVVGPATCLTGQMRSQPLTSAALCLQDGMVPVFPLVLTSGRKDWS